MRLRHCHVNFSSWDRLCPCDFRAHRPPPQFPYWHCFLRLSCVFLFVCFLRYTFLFNFYTLHVWRITLFDFVLLSQTSTWTTFVPFFATGSYCVTLAGLGFAMSIRLAINFFIFLLLPPECWEQRDSGACLFPFNHFLSSQFRKTKCIHNVLGVAGVKAWAQENLRS